MTLFPGVQIVESILAVDRRQVRFPRTKKRRIQKKWQKQERNWRSTPAAFLLEGHTLYCHPVVARQLRDQLRREEDADVEK